MSMNLVLQQVLVIFCYVAVGVGAGKLGIIDPDQRKYLTKLCSGLILPFTILSAASMEVGAEGFRSLGLECFEPRGAFYMFPCIKSTGMTSEQFCDRFLAEQRVAVIPGSAFGPGGEGFVRACYAASMHDLGEALNRLEVFLKSL